MDTLFPLGKVVVTPGAHHAFKEAGEQLTPYLNRHASGDWSETDPDERRDNVSALDCGLAIRSTYYTSAGKLWILTEADRSATTILMPEEQ
ncbi:MAG: hypothetical protein ACR2HO_12745 [Rubrobacteraceae bacterium]|nr:hypothetical protein [Rubrobacter sp.]